MPARNRLAPISVALLLVGAGCAVVSAAVYGTPPAIPKIEDSAGWQLSEGCQVYKFGILTEPDCDILTGEGCRRSDHASSSLDLPPGQDNRPIIGIQLQPDHGHWYFSSPFVTLVIAGEVTHPRKSIRRLCSRGAIGRFFQKSYNRNNNGTNCRLEKSDFLDSDSRFPKVSLKTDLHSG
jgi:hypothetical protein